MQKRQRSDFEILEAVEGHTFGSRLPDTLGVNQEDVPEILLTLVAWDALIQLVERLLCAQQSGIELAKLALSACCLMVNTERQTLLGGSMDRGLLDEISTHADSILTVFRPWDLECGKLQRISPKIRDYLQPIWIDVANAILLLHNKRGELQKVVGL
jgi:hypothetical protein